MKELNLLIASPTVGLDECRDKVPGQLTTTVVIPYSEMERDDKHNIEYEKQPPQPHKQPPTALSLAAIMPQVLAAVSVSLGSMVVGFSSAYTSPAIASMNSNASSLHVTPQEESWIGSLMPLCALFGGIAGGPLIETIGRRTTILSTAIPFILSFLLIASATNVATILAGRSISGFCVGIASLALPVYLGETVQPEVRGTLGLLPTTFGNSGILICFIAGKYLDWSLLAMLGAAIPVPFLLCMFLIPETPRWFVEKGKQQRARKALQWLRGNNTDVSYEFSEIEKSNKDAEKCENESAFKELFSAKYSRPLIISIGLMFFQQLSGINAVIFYTVSIFKDAGSTIDENLSTIIVGIVNMGSTFVATMLIDRLGRKILLYVSSTLMTITLLILGTFFYVKNVMQIDTTEYGWVPLGSFVVFVIGFSIGFGPIPWLMLGEILPAKIRGTAAALATGFNWSCTFLVTKSFSDLKAILGQHGAFWMFGVICLFGLVFVILLVPETQGKSLEDIERNLTGSGKDKVPVRTVRRMSSIANLKPLPSSI
ncbi:facilitated trehalose transporter Tret1 isoform X2 [Nilaparvata lugens]|nr:facilitated trehalose transporter Tret1 isoform X2 [Nilaparvata lugens]